MYRPIRQGGEEQRRMQEGQEQVWCIDEHDNLGWVPADRVASGGEGLAQAAEPQPVIEVEVEQQPSTTPENTTTQSNDTGRAAATDTQGQQVASFWLTNAGAGCAFVMLWIAGSMVGGFVMVLANLGVVSPDIMVGCYIAGAVFWFGGYIGVFLPWWYRCQPWTPVKTTVIVSVRDRRGRVRADRQGRVITEEQERIVMREVDGRLFVRAWRPFTYTWLPARSLGLTEEEVRAQYEQD